MLDVRYPRIVITQFYSLSFKKIYLVVIEIIS
jgi:hypothetical protein